MTCKNSKTLIFGLVLLSILVSVPGITIAQADEDDDYDEIEEIEHVEEVEREEEHDEEHDEVKEVEVPQVLEYAFVYEEFPTGSYVAGMPYPDSGVIECLAPVTAANPCMGNGISFAIDTSIRSPSTGYYYEHLCNNNTVPCVTLHWSTDGYPNSIYDPNADDVFFWKYGNTFSCSQTWGCTNAGYWNESNQSPNIVIRDAPTWDPITTYVQFNYKSNSGQWASFSMAHDITTGFG